MKSKKTVMEKDGNAAARREPMQYGGMGKKKMMGGGRMMYNKGGKSQPQYKSGDMPKCMPN